MIFWSIKFLWVLIEFLKCIWKLNWVKIDWNWKRKENWKKNKSETNYQSFNISFQTACHSLCVHCCSCVRSNDLSSGIYAYSRSFMWSNDVSFVCIRRLVVRRRKKRRIVRMYQTTCRSEKEETTCRLLLPDDLSFGSTETNFLD